MCPPLWLPPSSSAMSSHSRAGSRSWPAPICSLSRVTWCCCGGPTGRARRASCGCAPGCCRSPQERRWCWARTSAATAGPSAAGWGCSGTPTASMTTSAWPTTSVSPCGRPGAAPPPPTRPWSGWDLRAGCGTCPSAGCRPGSAAGSLSPLSWPADPSCGSSTSPTPASTRTAGAWSTPSFSRRWPGAPPFWSPPTARRGWRTSLCARSRWPGAGPGRPSLWHDAALVAGKDLRIELRSRVGAQQVAPFALVVLVLFAFAFDADHALLQQASAGLFWVAVLLAAVLAVQRSFAAEASDAARDGLRLSGLDPAAVFVGKAAAIGLQLAVLQVVLAAGVVVLYSSALRDAPVVIGSAALATVGLAAAGTLYGVVAASLGVRETPLPLLLLPVVAPVLLSASKAWQAALVPGSGDPATWLRVLAVFAVVYVAAGFLFFGSLLEES